MQRIILIAVLTGTCLSPLNANANPYAAYRAKFFGEYLLDKRGRGVGCVKRTIKHH